MWRKDIVVGHPGNYCIEDKSSLFVTFFFSVSEVEFVNPESATRNP